MSTENTMDDDEQNGIELSTSARLGRVLYRDKNNLKKKIKLFDDSMDTELETDIESDIEPEPMESYLSSLSHTTSCQIEFENESSINIYCYWIQYDSNIRKPPHCIYSLSNFRINTYLTHPFILSTSDSLNAYNYDTIIAVYIPTNSNYLIHHLIINDDLETITVNPFHEDIKPSSDPLGIIHCYSSDINTDYCCNQKYKSYPRNYPKTFQFHQFVENILRIFSLSCDLILIYLLINDNYVSNSNDIKISNLDITRQIFTFLPGFFLYLLLIILYTIQNGGCCCCKNNDEEEEEEEEEENGDNDKKECLKTICISLALLLLIFLYKILMILLCIYRIYFVFKRISSKKTLGSDVEIKHIIFLYPLLYDAILSGWPLFVISFFEIIINSDNNEWIDIEFIVLFIKIISCGLLIISDIDRLRFWRNSIYDPKILTPVCMLHRTRPYPMRIMQIEQEQDCIICGENIENAYIFYCAHSKCNDNFVVCMECGWFKITKYQQYASLDDEEFYQQLIVSAQFMKLYGDIIDKYAEINNLGNISKPICWINIGFNKWFIKCLYNLFQFFILFTGLYCIQQLFEINNINDIKDVYNVTNNNNDIIIIYSAIFLSLSVIFRIILLIIQCIYLFPKYANSTEKLFAKSFYNLFFIFYLLGFCLLLFNFNRLNSILITIGLISFIMQLVFIPFLSLWQIYESNAYLWQ